MKRYDPKSIEPKWQQVWADTKLYAAKDDDTAREKYYYLVEFPYPSGDGLHVGHVLSYTALDIMARHKRMQGFNVLYPMGFDEFGLPTENYAIKHKIAPQLATERNVATFERQLKSLGLSFDWDREVRTSDPSYYKWTQWIFLQLHKKGLAYQAEIAINWCPFEKTGLANEEVVDGKHERCGTPVERKLLKQWVLKITEYADRLAEDLKSVDYLDRISAQQINWIGRSEGAEITWKLQGITGQPDDRHSVTVYTTRPDTLFGATFLVISPEVAGKWLEIGWQAPDAAKDYIKKAINETELSRQEEKTKTGVDTGIKAVHPLTGELVPVWVADYVLGSYGTGAIMAVPAHDQRDNEFARTMNQAMGTGKPQVFVDEITPPKPELPFKERQAALAIVKHPTQDKYLVLRLKAWQTEIYSFPMGGIELSESAVAAAQRELTEETGYDHIANATGLGAPYTAEFYHEHKQVNRRAHVQPVLIELKDLHQRDTTQEEQDLHEILWLEATGVLEKIHGSGSKKTFTDYLEGRTATPLKITPVIEPVTGTPNGDDHKKEAIVAVVLNPKTGETLMLDWGPRHANWGGMLFVGGGIDEGEDHVAAAMREITEETGYTGLKFVGETPVPVVSHYYSNVKDRHDRARMHGLLFELQSDAQVKPKLDEGEKGKFKPVWVPDEKVLSAVSDPGHELIYRMLTRDEVYTGYGVLTNSGDFNGLEGTGAKRAITKALFDQGTGKGATKYKLRDWIFSRQHYWGEPIPIVHCPACGAVPVPEDQLPVTLPVVDHYEPTDTGESPLAAITDWVNTTCPQCGGPAKRETDTMPNWAGSSWYYLRYIDPHNDQAFADPAKLKYWTPVDLYNGGMEHTTLHLLYSRFWHKFLYDQGLVPTPEPYAKRTSHGMILGPDGQKMSKSKGNVINPDHVVAKYGADTIRLYEMFMGPFDEAKSWSEDHLAGVSRFLYRVWTLTQDLIPNDRPSGEPIDGTFVTAVDRITHKTLKRVHDNIGSMSFNLMVSALMEYINFLSEPKTKAALLEPQHAGLAQRTVRTLILMIAPSAPHMAEELWEQIGGRGSVHVAAWPAYDHELIKDDVITVVVQVNGKVRANLALPASATEADLTAAAQADAKVAGYLKGQTIVKTIVVPRKLVNFVVKPGAK